MWGLRVKKERLISNSAKMLIYTIIKRINFNFFVQNNYRTSSPLG